MAGKLRAVLGVLFAATLIGNAACSGDTGPAGPAGKQGPKGDPGNGSGGSGSESLNGVTPASAFLGATLDVTVSGDATSFDSSTNVAFGDGIKVNKVTVASPTALVVNITIAPNAAMGARDIAVGDDKYAGGFSVDSPLKLTLDGTVAQGSVVWVQVRDLDFTTPFDSTTTGDGLFTPISYPNIALSLPTGVATQINSVSDYALGAFVVIDVNQPASKSDLTIKSGPAGNTASFEYPGGFDIVARSAKVLGSTAATADLSALGASALFKYAPANANVQIVDIVATSSDENAFPVLLPLAKSGKFADQLGSGAPTITQVTLSTDAYYLVALDGTNFPDAPGYAGYTAKIGVTETPATGATDTEPNDSRNSAQTVSAAPIAITAGTLTDDTDEDWFKVPVTAADSGKQVHVTTMAGDPFCDTFVEVYDTDGTTQLVDTDNEDAGYHEDVLSDAISTVDAGGGFIWVKISASQAGYFDPMHNAYKAAIRLQ